MIRIFLLWLCLLLVQVSLAQKPAVPFSNLRTKVISTRSMQVQLDTLSLFPNTVTIPNINPSQYSIDAVNATLTWLKSPAADSVLITYRVFPYRLNAVTQHLQFDSIRNNFLLQKPITFKYSNKQNTSLFDFGNMNDVCLYCCWLVVLV